MEVDDDDILYLLSITEYSPFNTFTTNPYIGFYNQSAFGGIGFSTCMFIAGFDNNLDNFWTTLFGGDVTQPGFNLENTEVGASISVYNAESLYIAGSSFNTDFPTECPGIIINEWCDFPLNTGDLAQGSGTISRFNVSNAVGIEEKINEADNGLVVFPNPANTTITIVTADNITEIKLYNGLGQVVLSDTPDKNSKKVSLNIDKYPMGFYTIQVKTNENQLLHEKLIIK